MSTTLEFKVGPIRAVTLDPCPGHAMGPSVNVEISSLIGKHHGLITPAQAQQLGLALVKAGQEASGGQCCPSPRPDCMGMLVAGVGDKCKAIAGGNP